MIPYEDLVNALQSWRARQGLPVAQLAATPVAPRAAPPTAPPRAASPLPLSAPPEDSMDVDDAALLDEEPAYEAEGIDGAEGSDFGAELAASVDADDSTSIGGTPAPTARPSESTLDDDGTEVASDSGKIRGW